MIDQTIRRQFLNALDFPSTRLGEILGLIPESEEVLEESRMDIGRTLATLLAHPGILGTARSIAETLTDVVALLGNLPEEGRGPVTDYHQSLVLASVIVLFLHGDIALLAPEDAEPTTEEDPDE